MLRFSQEQWGGRTDSQPLMIARQTNNISQMKSASTNVKERSYMKSDVVQKTPNMCEGDILNCLFSRYCSLSFSVRRTARKFGFKEVSDDDDWTLYWTDFSVALERVMDMKKYQVFAFIA